MPNTSLLQKVLAFHNALYTHVFSLSNDPTYVKRMTLKTKASSPGEGDSLIIISHPGNQGVLNAGLRGQ